MIKDIFMMMVLLAMLMDIKTFNHFLNHFSIYIFFYSYQVLMVLKMDCMDPYI